MKISIAVVFTALFARSSAFAPALSSAGCYSKKLPMSSVTDAPSEKESSSSDATSSVESSGDVGADVDIANGDRQKLYGKGLDLPETYVMCGRCKTAYALQADDLGTRGKGRYV